MKEKTVDVSKIEKRLAELQVIQQKLSQQVIIGERNLQGLREQHASCTGAVIELRELIRGADNGKDRKKNI